MRFSPISVLPRRAAHHLLLVLLLAALTTFVAAEAEPPLRWIYGQLWLTAPLVRRLLARQPAGNAAVRTTGTVTCLRSGLTGNVVPDVAQALLNFRVKPTDRMDAVVGRVRRSAARHGADVEMLEANEPSAISSPEGTGYRALTDCLGEIFPDAVPAPCLVPNASDSRHFADLARDQYRFVPVRLRREDLRRVHGTDERIGIDNYAEVVRFFGEFIRRVDEAP